MNASSRTHRQDRMGLDTHLNAMTAQAPISPSVGPYPAGTDLRTELQSAGVAEDRIEQVAALIERASMLDDVVAINGGAGVGSIIKVADRAGRTTEYELVGRADGAPVREQVSLASATGKALLAARPGDRVRVTHANGRQRRVRVVSA